MLVIFNLGIEDRNFYYLSGIEEPCEGVVLWDGTEVKVLTSPLEAGIAEKYVEDVLIFKNSDELWNLLERETRDSKVIGVNMERLPAKVFRKLRRALKGRKIEDISKKLWQLRMIKNEEELEKIKRASEIASRVMKKVPELIVEEPTEVELAVELEYLARKLGATGFGFSTIVTSGKNTVKIHASPENKKITGGEVVIVDIGPSYKMYASDMTRTFILGRNREAEKVYEKVREASEKVLEAVEEGTEARELWELVKHLKMPHALGHGIGLEVHEPPVISGKSSEVLKKGMVLAIEPAVYSPFGIRIEDVVLVDRKAQVLTEVPRDLEFAVI